MSDGLVKIKTEDKAKQIFSINARLENGSKIRLINIGCALQSLGLSNAAKTLDTVLGFDDPRDYLVNNHYMGVIVGRWANRIANSSFMFGDKQIKLKANHGKHQIHGGKHGLSHVNWDFEVKNEAKDNIKLSFYYHDDYHGEFPAEVDFKLNLCFRAINASKTLLKLHITATPSKQTPLNITYHPYFNLGGADCDNLDDHQFEIPSSLIAEVDDENIPSGKIIDISNSDYDFRRLKSLTELKSTKTKAIIANNGIDNYYFVKTAKKARVINRNSGLSLEVKSSMPGLQFYSGGHISGVKGKAGRVYNANNAFCLEPHYPPASIFLTDENHPNTVFSPTDKFNQTIEYHFQLSD